MQVKFLDLKKINKKYSESLKKAASGIIDSGWYINGTEVRLFEEEFAQYCGTRYAIGVGNGFDALYLTLLAFKIQGYLKDGDEVLVPSNTFIATVLAVSRNGLKPILVEPDSQTFNLSCVNIEKYITKKTKVIVPVHLYGNMANMDEILNIGRLFNLLVLEDAAQAHGAYFNKARAGSLGKAGCFSFYPGKNLGTLGDGGAIVTDDSELADVVRSLGNYGSKAKYFHTYKGVNSRLDEIQAAFLRVKLRDLDNEIQRRRHVALQFLNKINNSKLRLPSYEKKDSHVFHLFVVRCKTRTEFINYLKQEGVETVIHYPVSINKQMAYQEMKDIDLPITSKLQDEIVSLPLNSSLTQEEINYIIKVCNSY